MPVSSCLLLLNRWSTLREELSILSEAWHFSRLVAARASPCLLFTWSCVFWTTLSPWPVVDIDATFTSSKTHSSKITPLEVWAVSWNADFKPLRSWTLTTISLGIKRIAVGGMMSCILGWLCNIWRWIFQNSQRRLMTVCDSDKPSDTRNAWYNACR